MRNVAIVVGCLAMWGCALDGALPEDLESVEAVEGEQLGSVQEAAVLGWFTGPFATPLGTVQSRRLEPVETHVCALTGVSGNFSAWDREIKVTHDGTHWFLNAQGGVRGEAHCYRKDAFSATTATRYVSLEREIGFFLRDGNGCAAMSEEALSGSAFTFLQGMGGKWNSTNERTFIDQSPSDSVASIMTTRTCTGNAISSYARSFRVGPVSGRIATFYTAEDGWGDVNTPSTLFSAGSLQYAIMAKTKFTMCALTEIRGKFRAAGDSVQIRAELVDGVERWVLRSSPAFIDGQVSAKARCYARDQTG